MPEQVQKTKARKENEPPAPVDTGLSAETREHVDDTLADTDDLLDEIDGLLEPDAEAFVQAYVQKGGE